jgi:hypothetical protein
VVCIEFCVHTELQGILNDGGEGFCTDFSMCVVRRSVWYSVCGFGGWEGIASPGFCFQYILGLGLYFDDDPTKAGSLGHAVRHLRGNLCLSS